MGPSLLTRPSLADVAPGPDGRGEPSSLPFRELENVLMTPHSSGVTHHTFVGRVADIASNINALAVSMAR